MRVSSILAATLAALASVANLAVSSTLALELVNGKTSFKKALNFMGATTTYNETDVWGARYYFTLSTLSLPEDAGEALRRVTINQRQGFEAIDFKLKNTQAFVGTPRNQGERLTLQAVTKGPESPTISVTFDPPVQPGTTVTIELRPVRNPSFSRVYIFGVTAFPAVENPYGLYLGVGRLQFYDSRPDFFLR